MHGRAGCKVCDTRAELCHWGQSVGWCNRLRSMSGSCQRDSCLVTVLEAQHLSATFIAALETGTSMTDVASERGKSTNSSV